MAKLPTIPVWNCYHDERTLDKPPKYSIASGHPIGYLLCFVYPNHHGSVSGSVSAPASFFHSDQTYGLVSGFRETRYVDWLWLMFGVKWLQVMALSLVTWGGLSKGHRSQLVLPLVALLIWCMIVKNVWPSKIPWHFLALCFQDAEQVL